MFVMDCLSVNEKGHLTIGGCDTIQLAKEYGTPLYVMDETTIRNQRIAFLCQQGAQLQGDLPHYHGRRLRA